jgi:hypothetical protein
VDKNAAEIDCWFNRDSSRRARTCQEDLDAVIHAQAAVQRALRESLAEGLLNR